MLRWVVQVYLQGPTNCLNIYLQRYTSPSCTIAIMVLITSSLWLAISFLINISTVASYPSSNEPGKVKRAQYKFNALSSSNVAVYFGRTDQTDNTNLTVQCQDKNVDIVILAFLTDVYGSGGYPDMAFDKLCSGQTNQMRTAGATGLLSCTSLASEIQLCQKLGKKVLLGIGGQNGNATFSSASMAESGATLLWNLFGGGSAEISGMRPFGPSIVDGFDIGMGLFL